jgi:uncharacterized protein (TIGR00266 family)
MSGYWYLGIQGKKHGPMEEAEAQKMAKRYPNAYAWQHGFAGWVPVKEIPALGGISSGESSYADVVAPPDNSDDIEYKLYGNDMQMVEIILDHGETVVAEPGAMVYKDPQVEMKALLGDGKRRGMMGKLFAATNRVFTGENAFITAFTNKDARYKRRVALGAPYPGRIIAINLKACGGSIICQRQAFLCAARGVDIKVYVQKSVMTGLFSGHGFLMQRLSGDGLVFVHTGGTIREFMLKDKEVLEVETGALVGFESSVAFTVGMVASVKSQLFAGEGFFLTTLTGPGKVWVQSLPFTHIAEKVAEAFNLDPAKIKKIQAKVHAY